MNYPKKEEVPNMDRVQLGRFYRFLPSPTNREEEEIMWDITVRFRNLGGWTPALSQLVGWEE